MGACASYVMVRRAGPRENLGVDEAGLNGYPHPSAKAKRFSWPATDGATHGGVSDKSACIGLSRASGNTRVRPAFIFPTGVV